MLEFTSAASTLTEGLAATVAARIRGAALPGDVAVSVQRSGTAGTSDASFPNPARALWPLTVPAGATAVVEVRMGGAHDDAEDEPAETVRFVLAPGQSEGYRLGPRSVHTVTIVDDDPTPVCAIQ